MQKFECIENTKKNQLLYIVQKIVFFLDEKVSEPVFV